MKEQKRVPKLRFPDFTDDWKRRNLGETCEVKTGNKDTKNKVDEGKYPFYVRSNTIERIDTYSYDGEAILTSGDGVGVGKNFHYVNGKFDYHQRVYALKEFKEGFNAKFIYQVFSEKFYRRVLGLSAKNSVDSVRMDFITKMIIGFPSLPEQQKIASFLSSVDKKIAQLQQKQEFLEDYKRGVMQQIFSQVLRFRKPDGSVYPDWEEKRLNKVSNINPKARKLPNSFYYIDLESVNKGILNRKQRVELKNAPSRAQRLLKKGDILFQTVRPYQKNNLHFNLSDDDFVASTGYAQIRAYESASYLFHFLHTNGFVNRVLSRCTGTSYPTINSSDLGKILIKIPCPDEQTQIAHFLSAIDKKIATLQTQIEQTQTFKKGLLQQLFV